MAVLSVAIACAPSARLRRVIWQPAGRVRREGRAETDDDSIVRRLSGSCYLIRNQGEVRTFTFLSLARSSTRWARSSGASHVKVTR